MHEAKISKLIRLFVHGLLSTKTFFCLTPIRRGAVNFFRFNRTLYDDMYVFVGWLRGKVFVNLRKWFQLYTFEFVLDINVNFFIDELKFFVFFFEGNVDLP